MKLPRDHHHRDLLEVENGIAATGHPDAARAAVTVMEQGGNAFDAIVAAGFTACVVEPLSCGIGGHGRLSARSAQAGRFITYDFQVRAPAAAHARMFGDPARPCEGAMAVGVPGLVAGLCAVHAELGTLPLPTIMAPAIACAERGYDFNWKDAMAIALLRDTLAGFPAAADLLLPGGKSPEVPFMVLKEQSRMDQSGLARTLRRIAGEGARAFYDGPVARSLAHAVTTAGGIMTEGDLSAYRVRTFDETPQHFADLAYVTGDDTIAKEVLSIIHYRLAEFRAGDEATRLHILGEALALGFADGLTFGGDSDHASVPDDGLLDPDYCRERSTMIAMDQAIGRPVPAGDPWRYSRKIARTNRPTPTKATLPGTSHLAVADGAGNVAAATLSVTGAYGSLIYDPESGVFLNSSMQNFDARPDHPNAVAPGKMPLFGVPVLTGRQATGGILAGAGAGGLRSGSGVVAALLNRLVLDHDLQTAVSEPRLHSQGRSLLVDDRIADATRQRLVALGHTVIPLPEAPTRLNFSRVGFVEKSADGLLRAGAAPLGHTAVAGF